jgi:hypothetical protein
MTGNNPFETNDQGFANNLVEQLVGRPLTADERATVQAAMQPPAVVKTTIDGIPAMIVQDETSRLNFPDGAAEIIRQNCVPGVNLFAAHKTGDDSAS